MSDDTKSVGDADQAPVGDQPGKSDGNSQGSAGEDKVSYETYLRTLDEAKKAKSKLSEIQDQLDSLKKRDLESQGKLEELLDMTRQENEKLKGTIRDKVSKVVHRMVEGQVIAKAQSMGCIDPDALSKLTDISSIEVNDETMQADDSQISGLLDSLKKDKPYLFNKKAPSFDNSMPNPSASSGSKQKDFSKMSTAELLREAARLKKRG